MYKWKKMLCLHSIGLVYGLLEISTVFALPCTFQLNYFELNGNRSVDVTDDFNDNILNPALWKIYDPSVTESGSSEGFYNPGTLGLMQLESQALAYAMSYIHSDFKLADGSGGYSVASTWIPTTPCMNQFYVMNLSVSEGVSVGSDANIMIGVANFDVDISSILGTAPSPAIFFARRFGSAGKPEIQGHIIRQENLLGSILFRMTFNELTGEFSGAFSLDAGASFQPPFDTIAPTTAAMHNQAEVSLGTESWQVVTVPPVLVLMFSGLLPLFAMKSLP
jgi:hypothetical protein